MPGSFSGRSRSPDRMKQSPDQRARWGSLSYIIPPSPFLLIPLFALWANLDAWFFLGPLTVARSDEAESRPAGSLGLAFVYHSAVPVLAHPAVCSLGQSGCLVLSRAAHGRQIG